MGTITSTMSFFHGKGSRLSILKISCIRRASGILPTLSGNDGKNNWNAGLGMDLIRGYDRVRKLSPEELKYLYVYLAYPEKFWKIANRYYNSHKAWLSGRNIEKLEKVVAQEDAREQFLQMLFHFTV